MGMSSPCSSILEGFPVIKSLQVDISVADIQNGKLLLDLSGKHLDLATRLFYGDVPVSDLDITIKCDTLGITVGASAFTFASKNVRSITFVCNQDYLIVSGIVTGGTGTATNCLNFYGLPFYVTSAASGNYGPFGRANFVHADFVENVATGEFYIGKCSLLDDHTCISVANALNAGSPNTITYHSTPKGRLATIMGRVESVTNNEETYSKFVEDDSGTMSLQDFITNVKGWTLG